MVFQLKKYLEEGQYFPNQKMAPEPVYLPDGQTFTASPVFGGIAFKGDAVSHESHFPVGWMTVLHTEEEKPVLNESASSGNGQDGTSDAKQDDARAAADVDADAMDTDAAAAQPPKTKKRICPFTKPTLQNDTLFISSISNPSSQDYTPPASPTRHIAMMLWVTLYWYFHQPEPEPYLHTTASQMTPDKAKPSGEWRITIQRDGIFRGRNLIPKLERMGLIATEDTSVGTFLDDTDPVWTRMFITKRMFWQIPPGLFLFTLKPVKMLSPMPGSPAGSRPGTPSMDSDAQSLSSFLTPHAAHSRIHSDLPGAPVPMDSSARSSCAISPYFSTSHLPTYYPPPPLQYTFTGNIRHPIRSKPPRMGEVFYTRFIPSVGQYLSFRVASLSSHPVPYLGPIGANPPKHGDTCNVPDSRLMEMWLANPRVNKFWGDYHPKFLQNVVELKHSFPVIGMWDGVPFGYFEIYWVKEDILGQFLGSETNDFDRGLHVLVGEEWARGRAPEWMTSLVHWCFIADMRTMNVCLEPRVDNDRYVSNPCWHCKRAK